jgi:cobalamin synthase
MTTESHPGTRIVPARSARFAARIFNYGNIIAMILPLPIGILWAGASMLIYALNRHHPNERVGYYTQQAAYRLYGVLGFVVVVATFFGTNPMLWAITWAICAAILIPWSIVDLHRIRRETWTDTVIPD